MALYIKKKRKFELILIRRRFENNKKHGQKPF